MPAQTTFLAHVIFPFSRFALAPLRRFREPDGSRKELLISVAEPEPSSRFNLD